MNFDPGPFKVLDTNPGGTLECFNKYVERMKLIFDLAFRKSDGTPYDPTDKEKKSMLLFRGGDDMKDLFELVGQVAETDTFDQAIAKIVAGLKGRTNAAVQRNLLLTNHPQGSKSFERWSKEITNTAKLIDYNNYDWKAASVDAMLLQTSNPKLRERALQEDIDYEKFMKLGIAKEQSVKGAAQLEHASGNHSHTSLDTEEVRRLRLENKKLKNQNKKRKTKKKPKTCGRCGYSNCQGNDDCPAMGETCSGCGKPNHFKTMCRTKPTKSKTVKRISSDDDSSSGSDSSEPCDRILVGSIHTSKSTATNVFIGGDNSSDLKKTKVVTDTGVRYTLLNLNDWDKVKHNSKSKRTSKKFRPYGTKNGFRLPIRREAKFSFKQ